MDILDFRKYLIENVNHSTPIILCERGESTIISGLDQKFWFCRVVGFDNDLITKVFVDDGSNIPGWKGLPDDGVIVDMYVPKDSIDKDDVGGELAVFSFDLKNGEIVYHKVEKQPSSFYSV